MTIQWQGNILMSPLGSLFFMWAFFTTANSCRVKKKGWVFLKHHFPSTKELNFRLQLSSGEVVFQKSHPFLLHLGVCRPMGHPMYMYLPGPWEFKHRLLCSTMEDKLSTPYPKSCITPQVDHSLRETSVVKPKPLDFASRDSGILRAPTFF